MLALEPASTPDNADVLAAELASVAETLATTGQDAIPMRRHETLSVDEQRVAAVVLLAKKETGDELRPAALRDVLAEHGARAERLADGTTKVTFTGESTPLETPLAT
jgi:hypothetical protein